MSSSSQFDDPIASSRYNENLLVDMISGMSLPRRRSPLSSRIDDQFASTRWSIVIAAGREPSPDSQHALELLCQAYWFPLYAYVRRRVPNVHEAQDLTQEFFSSLLERHVLRAADRERGRFRAFLLTSFKSFLADEWDKAKALKRGGGRQVMPLDFASAESRSFQEPADESNPEKLYERQWALTVLELVLDRLRDEYVAKGKEKQFETFKQFLGDNKSGRYEVAAETLKISTGAAKVAAHRMRRRYGELLRAEITETVAAPGDVDDEIRSLRANLG